MAKTAVARRDSRGQLTWVWMALAVVLIAGFMVWLGVSSEPSQLVAVREDGEAVATPTDQPTPVEVDAFADNPAAFRGRHVELADLSVAARLGDQAFWANLPGNVPFLVRLSPELVADGRRVSSGDRVTIAGVVFERTDSVLVAWEQQGVITAGQRDQAEFAADFIEARRITAVAN
jgi:hypothetical protein